MRRGGRAGLGHGGQASPSIPSCLPHSCLLMAWEDSASRPSYSVLMWETRKSCWTSGLAQIGRGRHLESDPTRPPFGERPRVTEPAWLPFAK